VTAVGGQHDGVDAVRDHEIFSLGYAKWGRCKGHFEKVFCNTW